MQQEIWKEIPGYPEYKVSNLGRVQSYKKKNGPTLMNGELTHNGYIQVTLNHQRFKLHRLVAMAFIPNPDSLPQINHKNEIKTDNRVENLEWCTAKYNNNYGTKLQRYSITRGKRLVCIESGIVYPNLQSAAKDLNLDFSHIAKCCRGVLPQHKGFHFKYV